LTLNVNGFPRNRGVSASYGRRRAPGRQNNAPEIVKKGPAATVDTLAARVRSTEQAARLNTVANIDPRMRIDDPHTNTRKAAIFDALVAHYASVYATHPAPVFRLLREMYDNTAKTLGVGDGFLGNLHTPESVLIDMTSSPAMQVVQHGAVKRAKKCCWLEPTCESLASTHDAMAPS